MNEKEFYCLIVNVIKRREVNRGTNRARVSNSNAAHKHASERPAGLALDDRSSRRSYGMIDGKSRPGKRSRGPGPRLRRIRLINTGALVPVTFLGCWYRERSPCAARALVCDLQIRIC